MRFRKRFTIIGLVAVALLSAVAASIGSVGSATASQPAPKPAASALAAFRNEPVASIGEAAARTSLRNEIVSPEDQDLPLGQADFSLARSSSVPGSTDTVWIVPSGEDVCTIIVAPEETEAGPWGASCATVEEVDAGEGYAELTSPKGPTILADVTADGAAGPTIQTANGNETLTPNTNVASALLSRSDSVETPGGAISLTP
jgi:hypothetical protein